MTERTANGAGGNGNSNQSTSGGSARKHKKHKSSSSKHLVMDTSVDTIVSNTGQPSTSSSTTLIDVVVANDGNSQLSSSSISVCNELEIQCNSAATAAVPGTSSSGLTSPSSTTTKPLRLVLKMAQSGSYSPKLPLDLIDSEATNEQPPPPPPPNGTTNDDSSIQSINFVANNSGVPQSSSSSSMPPQLIPLNVDSFQNEFINSMKKSKKLKKSKKKHHHHHHHRSSNHHPVAVSQNSDREIINNLIVDGSSTDILMGGSDSNHQLLPPPPPPSSIESSMDSSSVNINAQLSMNGHYSQLHESSSSTIKQQQQPGNCDNLNEQQLNPTTTTTKIEIVNNNNQQQQASMNEIDENINPSLASTGAATTTTTSTLTSKYSQRNNQFNSTSSSTSLSPPKNYSLYRRLLQNGTVKYHANNISQQRPHRSLASSTILSSKSQTPNNNKSQTQFQRFLHHLLAQLRAKDLQKFFAWPPSDLLEPNYSAVVRNPMDFNTIQKKIDYGLYGSVQEMKFDVRVLCENALHYHPQSSIQYREAARLWHFAKTKVFHREAVSQLRQTLFPKLTNAEIGFESSSSSSSAAINTTTTINSSSAVNQPEGKLIKLELNSTNVVSTQNGVFDSSSRSSTALQALLSDVKSEPSTCDGHNGIKLEVVANDDDDDDDDYKLTPQELFRNARKSLGNSGAAVGGSSTMVLNGDYLESKFTVDRPSSDHLSMLRQRADGSTTLGLLSNLNGVDCDEISRLLLEDHSSEMSINIGRMVGKLNEGTTVLCPPYKEPDTNRIRPVRYFNDILHQSSRPSIHRSSFQYSSHLPFLDSSKATISLDESSLLLNTFGGESWDGEHRMAIEEAANNPDFMIPFVDSVLDIVSNGEYSKQSKQEPCASPETECEEPIDNSTTTTTIDADETKDQLLLEPTTTTTTDDNEMTLDEICDNLAQQQLNQIDQLLQELREIQYRRLSKTTEPIAPDEREQELAASISQQLVQLIGQCVVAPGEIIDVGAIRKAMGIVVDDSEPQTLPPLPEIITMDCD